MCSRIAYLEHEQSRLLADPVNTYREGYGFARCRAQICGDTVKGDHFRCLSRYQGGPDLEARCDGNYLDGL